MLSQWADAIFMVMPVCVANKDPRAMKLVPEFVSSLGKMGEFNR
jgi:hypothetical protein